MGQIQNGINQLIGQVGVLAHLSPGLRAKAETREATHKLQREEEKISKFAEEHVKSLDAHSERMKALDPGWEKLQKGMETPGAMDDPAMREALKEFGGELTKATNKELDVGEAEIALGENLNDRLVANLRQQAELNPSKDTYDKLRKALEAKSRTGRIHQDASENIGIQRNSMQTIMDVLAQKGQEQVKQKYSFQDLINDVSKAEREGY